MSARIRIILPVIAVSLAVVLASCGRIQEIMSRHAGESVALAQLPPPVRAAIEARSTAGQVKEIDKRTQGGRVVYVASIAQSGVEQHLTFADDGSLLGTSDKEDDDDD